MGLVKSVPSVVVEPVKWIKRNYLVIAINLSASIGLICMRGKCRRGLFTPTTTAVICIAGTWFYLKARTKERLSSRDAIVITGCDSGLGYSMAVHCQELGATVIAGVLQPDGPGAEKLLENGVHVRQLDVTEQSSVRMFTKAVQAILKEKDLVLRCLINNAGIMIFGEFEWQTEDQVARQLDVNFLGGTRVTRDLLPLIRAHKSRIIVVSSHCTSQPLPGVAVYGASKAALTAWASALRIELKKYGVLVVSFVPGSFTSQSNILARQVQHFETMRAMMGLEARRFYGGYFDRYERYFAPMSKEVEPAKVENDRLYEAFEGALLDRRPSAVYKCEPLRYFFYHTLFKVAPTGLRDLLIERFVNLPAWDPRDSLPPMDDDNSPRTSGLEPSGPVPNDDGKRQRGKQGLNSS